MRLDEQGGQPVEEVEGELHQGVQHPVAADQERDPDPDELGHEGERELLDLGHRPHERDDEPDDQGRNEDRGAELERDQHGLERDVEDAAVGHGVQPPP